MFDILPLENVSTNTFIMAIMYVYTHVCVRESLYIYVCTSMLALYISSDTSSEHVKLGQRVLPKTRRVERRGALVA